MAFRRRAKSHPLFSQEFLIHNHADIGFCLVLIVFIALMFEVRAPRRPPKAPPLPTVPFPTRVPPPSGTPAPISVCPPPPAVDGAPWVLPTPLHPPPGAVGQIPAVLGAPDPLHPRGSPFILGAPH
uniref:Uncharacterized protein n=1 Tax=Anas platyrhynchos TaxID=8839 RepID=A0A8B9QS22_ANAPL